MARARFLVLFFILTIAVGAAPASAQCDVTRPVLTNFDFNPKSVDVSAGDQLVVVTFDLTDDVAGVDRVGANFVSPSSVQTVECNSVNPLVGNPNNGTYQCVVTVPRYSEAGTWSADLVNFTDKVERSDGFNTSELIVAGFPHQLQVTSVPDVTPPVLTGLTLTPLAVDVSAGLGLVACNITATDDLAGIAFAGCMLTAPSGATTSCAQFLPASGTPTNGTYVCDIPILQYSENGTWDVSVQLSDAVENRIEYLAADLLAGGFPDQVNVTSVPEDLTPPVLLTFDLQPPQVNVENADRIVTCTARLTDNLAGTAAFGCSGTFIDTNLDIISHACTALSPDSGNASDGIWSCDLTIPQYSPAGTWGFVTAIYFDAVGNAGFSDSNALALGGFPNTFDVICGTGGPPPGPVLSWATDFLVSWIPIAAATRYTLYGGSLNLLVDIDGNGLPDAGYGLCRISEDPDPTDSLFLDASMPLPGETLFLLVGYDTATGTDLGLGTTSGMLNRVPTLSCP